MNSHPPSAADQAAGDPQLPEALAAAIELLRSGHIDDAEPAFESILQRWPEQPEALHFMGVLRHAQGRTDEAVALIRGALRDMADNATAWNNLGNVLLLARRGDEAAAAYAQALEHATSDAERVLALNNLGVLQRKHGRLGESENILRQALELDAESADGWYNLSETLIRQGCIDDGLAAHARARALWPSDEPRRADVIHTLVQLGRREPAATLLREWLTDDPGNAVAQHMLAACDGGDTPARASDRYVEQVFDSAAVTFDAALEALGYRAPELVVQALAESAGAPAGRLAIVDAGCGTGLCGPGLKPWARLLVGCDLSERMLERARARRVYDRLDKAELTAHLERETGAFDAVVSADTLCYFGPLDAVFAAARRCLTPGGRLVFTVEALADDDAAPHRLMASGRFAHRQSYLRQALADAGFDVRVMHHERLRLESGAPVMGWLVAARLAGAA